MADEFTFSVEAHFADARPVLDVKYDIEKRVKRLLPRDLERPDALVFRGTSQSYTTGGTNTIELSLEAACDTHHLYVLRVESRGQKDARDQVWRENLRRTIFRWTDGLTLTESRAGCSPERFRQAVESIRELPPLPEDRAAICAVQDSIIGRVRGGERFFTAHKEGGTNISWVGDRFVFQDYGESEDREEFTSNDLFLERLRKFYDWRAGYDWLPHAPPELEAWRFIERELG